MKMHEGRIAKMEGAVFFDPLPFADSKEHWGKLCEQTRPAIRQALSLFGFREKLEIIVADEGFKFHYPVGDTEHSISVTKAQASFECKRLKVTGGVPPELAPVMEAAIKAVGREDWFEIGSIIYFAIPLKGAKGSTVASNVLRRFLLTSGKEIADRVFVDGEIKGLDLKLMGISGKTRVAWNVYNQQEDQHVVVSLDMKMYRHEMENDSIAGFISRLFGTFMERCAPFVQDILSSQDLASYIDNSFLSEGVNPDVTSVL